MKQGLAKESAALVCTPDRRGVRTFGVGGKVIDVAVTAGGQDNGVGQMRFQGSGDEISRDDAACFAIDHDEIEHLSPRDHGDGSGMNLAL